MKTYNSIIKFWLPTLMNRTELAVSNHCVMRGIHIFEKTCYREIRAMRGRAMRGPPVSTFYIFFFAELGLLVIPER